LKYLGYVLLLVVLFTGCSQHKVEVQEEPPVEIVKEEPKGIISEAVIQKAERKYGKHIRDRFERYNAKIYELQNSTTEVKLQEINNFFNKIPYFEDMTVWGHSDYWATPLEFLAMAKGDCEDYVIAKYFSLRNLGVEYEKLFFSYVKSTKFTRPHMVLSYFETPHSIPLVLDSINYKIFPANQRTDLVPVYNYNGESLYRVKEQGKNGFKVENNKEIDSRWQKLLDEIAQNKL
jgi:predicted transglutaminase-like cysteine proteinase